MKLVFMVMSLVITLSCNQKEATAPAKPAAVKLNTDELKSNSLSGEDQFADLKKSDATGCAEDEVKDPTKELEKAKKPALLQGGDSGCKVE